jgi:D-3-phosphoglycerate dehydrogenase
VSIHAVALALALLRRLPEGDASLRGGSWSGGFMDDVRRASTLTAGVVGLGRIGSATAALLAALGLNVIGHDPVVTASPYELVPLDELLARSHVVSLHAALTPDTRHLLSRERLALMRPGAVLVNVSRGELVDEVALADALVAGRLGGAGLDVFAEEPLPAGHPLRRAPHTILTPHVAWRSTEAVRDYQAIAVAQVRAALRGERMPHVVDPTVYERAAAPG